MTDYDSIVAGMGAAESPMANPLPSAVKTSPDAAARGARIHRATGVDAILAADHLPQLEDEQSQGKWDRIVSAAPKTARFLQSPIAAAISQDDTENLSVMERALRGLGEGVDNYVVRPAKGAYGGIGASGYGILQWMGEVTDQAIGSMQRGAAGAFSGMFLPEARQGQGKPTMESLAGNLSADNHSGVTGYLGYRSEQADLWQKEHGVAGGSYSNPVTAGVASGLQSAVQNLVTLPASVLLSGGAPTLLSGAKAMSPIMAMTFGQEVGNARREGLPIGQATAYAGVQAGVEGATELLPFTKLVGDIKASSPLWKTMVGQIVPDAIGEQAATVMQDLNEWANLHPEKTFQDYLDERPNAALQTAVASIVGSAVMTGPGVIMARAAYKKSEEADKAEARAKILEQINQGAAASKVLARDADTFQDFVRQAAEGGPVTDVYIDADVLNQSGLADQVLAASPAAAEQFQEALATGGQVRIPIDEYATHIAPQEYAQQLIEDIRLHPEDMTRREAQAYAQSGAMQELEAAMASIIGDKAQSDTFAASRDRVKQAVLDNLNTLGRFTPQKNELDATLIAARSATRAAQLGMTPEEFFNKHVLGVVAQGQAGGEALNQFAGQSALTADTGALKSAQDRVKAGEDAETVRKETGWHTGADGKWRFEIDDSVAKLNIGYKGSPIGKATNGIQESNGWMRLGDVLSHDQLFAAYPRMADMSVKLMPSAEMGGARGSISGDSVFLDDSLSAHEAKSVLLHEIQHAIQNYEGFATGGSSADAFADPRVRPGATKKTLAAANRLLAEKLAELRQPDSIEQFARMAWNTDEITPELEASYADYVKTVGEAAVTPNIQRAAQEWASKEWYRRLAGEVEARNTQARANMTAAERQATSPQATADVAERDQIVMFAQGLAEMVSNQPTKAELAEAKRQLDEQLAIADRMITERGGLFAPNGEKSKLNRMQWAQVRTANFRKWFGDWEIASALPERHADTFDKAREQAKNFQSEPLTNMVTGVIANVSRNNLDKMLSGKAVGKSETPAIHSLAVANLDGLFRRAVIGWSKPDSEGDANIKAIHRFFAPVLVNGRAMLAKMTVKETAQKDKKNPLYTVEAVSFDEIKNPAAQWVGEIADADGIDPRTIRSAGLVESMAQRVQDFNISSVSKVVDANGEPLVVYRYAKNEDSIAGGVRFFTKNADYAEAYFEEAGNGGGLTAPVYLRLKNPIVADMESRDFSDPAKELPYIKSAIDGPQDGVIFRDAGGTDEFYAALDASQIKSATGNAGTFSGETDNILYQPDGGPGPVKRGWFNPSTNTIALLKNADLSTFLHESGHYFLETDISIARDLLRDNAAFGPDTMKPGEQQILRDVSALLKWFGIEGDIVSQIDQWDRMDFEEKRNYHEQLAESFERYLMEGKAPSIELQTAFQSFRQWLFSVYKSVRDFLTRHPDAGQLNDEVRAVFDRMLATEEEIKLAEQARGLLPLFADAMNAGMTPTEFAEYQKLGVEATQAAIDQLQAQGMRDMKWLNNARSRMLKKLQRQAKAQRAEMRAAARIDVLREPVYQAWNVLTSKLTDEDKPAKKAKRSEAVDPAVDSLFEAIAKMGGLNKEAVGAQWGVDPKDKAESGLFGKPVLRAKDGGRTLDSMVEALTEEGYLTPDENGKGDIAELEEKFKAELRGDRQYSVIKNYEPEALAGQGEDLSGITAARIDRASLDDMEGLPQDVIDRLESLGMTAKTGGIHPDVLSEILPGWTSGDELVRAIAAAQPLNEAIEARTDQWMLEQYADLATPEAVERAADAAIHNDARERFLAAEHKALVKASGDKSQRQLLLSAAREYARQLIGRQRIRDIRPSMYTAAEARAAKAAATSKDLSQKATEKRNQILSGMAALEAYRARDDVDKGLRYLKKFDSPTIRKRINGDYADQIEALLEKVDLRKRSLKDIDRRKSFGAFVRSQIEKGIVPAMSDSLLPPNLRAQYLAKVMERNEDGELVIRDDVEQAKILADYLDMAEIRSYKDMTVDEFRGLIETIRQIEHLGRKKKSLLTARDGATYEQKRDELVDSVVANSEHLPDRMNRTIPNDRDEKLRGLRDFRISLRKIGMIMRLLDGNKDGGPMWDFFVRSANERGDWETEMIAQASEVLTKALRPVFSLKGGMRGKGVYFESLGRSLNREQRIGLALNVGNDGNLQRLLDGEGWSYADIQPVLQSLTKAEWDAVQAVWDHMDSYRPMIAAIEKRTVGAEPEWVQPVQFTVTTADGQTITLKGGYYPVKYDIEASQRSEELADAEDAKRAMNAATNSSTTHRSFVKKRSEAVVGRPLELSLSAMYSGVQDVIHDLAWREWLIDASKMISSSTLDDAIRRKYGAETVRAMRQWVSDIAAGTRKPRGVFDRAAAFLRKNVAASGLALNVMNAVQNVTGLQNSIERIGAKWMAVGQKEYLGGPKEAAAWVREKSSFMEHRARTQFRDLNELRNVVESGDGLMTKAKNNQFILITMTQKMVDTPTWIGAYRKAEADGAVVQLDDGSIDDSKAVAMADQAVIDAQGSGMTKDLSAVERGGELAKLFTAYYSYMNTTYNLAANRVSGVRGRGGREKGSAALHVLTLMAVPTMLMAILKAALTPGDDDDWDDPEKLAKKLAMEQASFAMGMVPMVREFTPMIQPFLQDQTFGYQGPSGMRIVGDATKFAQQASQGDFDDGFRKAAIGLSGSLFGLPAAQINRTWTGAEAMADDKTDNPAALLFGYQERK